MKKILTTLALVGVITTGAQAQSILISEINSNGTGGDFFEIYNYGATAVELGGWKWVDNASAVNGGPSFNGARAFAFAHAIASAELLIVWSSVHGRPGRGLQTPLSPLKTHAEPYCAFHAC